MRKENTVEIRHFIPGRIRIKVPFIRFNKHASDHLHDCLKDIKGIVRVRANPPGASIVIRYNPKQLSKTEITDLVRREQNCPVSRDKTDTLKKENSLKSAIIRFACMTILAGIVFVREVILKRPFAQTLFSPLGIVTAISALPLVSRGLKNIRERRFTLESFLGGSIVTAIAAGEATAALEILWITSGAEMLRTWITERSRLAIREILQVTAKNTYILADGVEVEIPVSDVQPGDTVVLHTGEKISVDGVITDGEAIVDESSVSGRSEPVLRQGSEKVFAGTFVRQGVIYVHAEKVGDKTYLARILRMVEESLENKAPVEGVAEELASSLIKTGFAVTLATLVITRSFWRAFSVMMVMACPCATILAASTAVSAALNAAARKHILIKGGRYLEEAAHANVVCFDKTGTLTTNQPELVSMAGFSDIAEDKLLQIACSAEKHNFHPVALAVKAEAKKRKIEPIPHEVCEYKLGRGVRAEIEGEEVLIGSRKLMETYSVNTQDAWRTLRKFDMQGLTAVFVARDKKLAGIMGFANQSRPDIKKVVNYLQNDGIREVAIITGDEKSAALELSRQLDISECYYSVMPEEKSGIVTDLKKDGHKVLMVGDGINDALALAQADVGVAMGAGGSDVAIEAADIALVKDDLKGLVYVRSLSHATIKVVHQNFRIATGSNVAGVVLGAMGILSPVMAGFLHIVHTFGVLANSSRLLSYEAPPLLNGDFKIVSEGDELAKISSADFEELRRIA